MLSINKIILIVIVWLTGLNIVFATHYDNIKFEHITIDDGLLESSVRCLLQDSLGYIWFGTRYGLCRYDGTVYKYITTGNENPNVKLSSAVVMCLENYTDNRLLIGTGNALNIYDQKLDSIAYYEPNFYRHWDKGNVIQDVYVDKHSQVWVATNAGISKMIEEKDSIYFKHYNLTGDKRNIKTVNSIYSDKYQNLWVATMDGLYIHHVQSDSMVRVDGYYTDKPIGTNQFISLYGDKGKYFWVGGNNRIVRCSLDEVFNFQTEIKIEVLSNNPGFLCNGAPSMYVSGFAKDKHGALWVATPRGLIIVKNADQAELECLISYTPSTGNKFSINGLLLSSILIDNAGIVWLGSRDKGISYYDPYKSKFETISKTFNNRETSVSNIIKASDNRYWLVTDVNGIYVGNDQNFFAHQVTDTFQGINSNYIIEDKFGNILYTKNNPTWGGIYLLPKKDQTEHKLSYNLYSVKRFTHENLQGVDESINLATGIFLDNNKDIWLTTHKSGLFYFEPQNNQQTPIKLKKRYSSQFFKDQTNSHAFNIRYFYHHNNNMAYISVYGVGVFEFDMDIEALSLLPFFWDKKNKNQVQSNVVFIIRGENDNELLMGTYGAGLIRYNLLNDSVKIVDKKIASNFITGAIVDADTNIWLSTNRGIAQVFPSGIVRNYDLSDGLQGLEFNANAFLKTGNGEMYFGGKKGLNRFSNTTINNSLNITKPATIINNLEINNKPYNLVLSDDNAPFRIEYLNGIKLKHIQNNIKIFFASLSYASPENNHFKYKLEGIDNDWVYVDANEPFAKYNNLKWGNYTFKVYGANSDGIFSEKPATLTIAISPAFWNTIAFRVLLGFISVMFIVLIVNMRTKRIKQKNYELDKLVKKRTREIDDINKELKKYAGELLETNTLLEERQQQIEEQTEELKAVATELKEQRDKLEDSNATKDKLFSIVAHDLKNPLNAVMGFTELLESKAAKYPTEKIVKLSSTANKAANAVYKLLENLLQWSRTQTGRIKFEPQTNVIVSLVEDVFSLLLSNAQSKGNQLICDIDPLIQVHADKDMIETVIRNLVSNAIKYTENGTIRISAIQQNDKIVILIEDTGIGMDKNLAENLFRLDRTSSREGTKGESGTGLGLIICKDFIEYHHGRIWVESSEGQGSTFYIQLPDVKA